jgi:hypothetical protein
MARLYYFLYLALVVGLEHLDLVVGGQFLKFVPFAPFEDPTARTDFCNTFHGTSFRKPYHQSLQYKVSVAYRSFRLNPAKVGF